MKLVEILDYLCGFRKAEDNDLEDRYFEGAVVYFKKLPLVTFMSKNRHPGVKAIYTLNLFTMAPTKSSPFQKQLTDAMKHKITVQALPI